MTTTTVPNLSGNTGRTFEIEVMGSPHQALLRATNYTLKVPYSSLAQTIHSIGQRGGKVVNVKMLNSPDAEAELVTEIAPVVTAEAVAEAEPVAEVAPVITVEPVVEAEPVAEVAPVVTAEPVVVEEVPQPTKTKAAKSTTKPASRRQSKSKKR